MSKRSAALALLLSLACRSAQAEPLRLSFAAAVARALQRNPTILVAQAELRRARALVEQVRAAALPTLVVSGAYTRLDGDRVLNDRVVAGADQLTGAATLAVPVLAPARWLQWSQSRLLTDIAAQSAADIRRQLALTTARTYLALVAQHRALAVLERARDTARAHRDFAHARRTGGVGARLDETRAEQELATDEAQVESAQANLARAQEALGVLLGADEPVDSTEVPRLSDPRGAGAIDAGAGLPGADEEPSERSDVRLARLRLASSANLLRYSFVDFLPSLGASFQVFYQNPPTLTVPLTGWQGQLALTLPLYDGGLRYGLLHERRALVEQARVSVEGSVRQARADVRAAQAGLDRSRRALAAAERASQAAAETLRLATLAYQAGATSNLEVIDAERRARDAETAVTIAEDQLRQDALDLQAATGRFPGPR